MKPKLTPEEKKRNDQLDDIRSTRNRCITGWSFKKLITYRDLLREATGEERPKHNDPVKEAELNSPISHKQILDFFKPFEDKINAEFEASKLAAVNDKSKAESLQLAKTGDSESVDESDELRPCADNEKLQSSAKQKAFLFPFQERAARKLLDGILKHNKKGQLLRAGVGTGKTYIVGAVARRLLDIDFCKGKTFSPWAQCWITRASIVEQTKRVLKEQFGICPHTEVQVINVEALRASFGDLMVRCETIIDHGEEHLKWIWRKGVHPIIFYIDESQFAKNDNSQQSQIIQSISEIDLPHIYCIFFSATPLMRVCEAKYMVLNCRLSTKGFGTELAQES